MSGLNKFRQIFKLGTTIAGLACVVAFSSPLLSNDLVVDTDTDTVSTAFSNLLNPQPTVFTDKTTFVIPFSARHGFEYSRTNDERYSNDWVEVSYVTAINNDYFGTTNDKYTSTAPMVLKVTLKGYSLFQSPDGKGEFFSFDQSKEQEIREPHLSVSVSKNF